MALGAPQLAEAATVASQKLVFLFVDDPDEAFAHTRLLESFGYGVRTSCNRPAYPAPCSSSSRRPW